jgi:hypothetical protein
VLRVYFVGGSVWEKLKKGDFFWDEYALARLSLLRVVLMLALFVTLAFDYPGSYLTDSVGYDGRWNGLLLSRTSLGINNITLSPITGGAGFVGSQHC